MSLPIVLITGASSGIGAAATRLFASRSWRVVALARRVPELKALANENSNILPLACDLSDLDATETLLLKLRDGQAKDILGRPIADFAESFEVLVNNAGIFERKKCLDTRPEEWRKFFTTNLFAAAHAVACLAPTLVSRGRGAIVNVASTLGLRTAIGTGIYSASKAAMINWSHTLALELAPHGIRVNSICPGLVDTPIHAPGTLDKMQGFQPLGRVGQPSEISEGIWYLSQSTGAWITGTELVIDGGIHLV